MNILTVSMLLVIVPYMFLYRTMRPAHQTQLRTSDYVDGMELSMVTNECEEHALDTDDLATVQLVNADFNIPIEDKPCTDSEESGCGEEGCGGDSEEEVREGQRQKQRILVKKRADNEQVLLLSDMDEVL